MLAPDGTGDDGCLLDGVQISDDIGGTESSVGIKHLDRQLERRCPCQEALQDFQPGHARMGEDNRNRQSQVAINDIETTRCATFLFEKAEFDALIGCSTNKRRDDRMNLDEAKC